MRIKVEALGLKQGDTVVELTPAEAEAAGQSGVVRVMARIAGERRSVLVSRTGALANNVITSLELTSATPEQVADLSHSYVLQYRPNAVYSDRVCMGTNDRGLLQYVEAGTKDETGNIIVSIAKLAGRFAGTQPFTTTGVPQKISEIELTVDPYNNADRLAASRTIDDHFPEFQGRFRLLVENTPRPKDPSLRGTCPVGSICYRTIVPVRIGLFDAGTNRNSVRYVNVANAEINNIDVTRAFMVEKVTRFGFTDGMLSYAVIRKPSEMLETAKLPLTVYDAMLTSALAAPGRFLNEIKPGATTAEVAAILTQQAMATEEITKLQLELARLRQDSPPDQPLRTPAAEAVAKFQIACAGPAANKPASANP